MAPRGLCPPGNECSRGIRLSPIHPFVYQNVVPRSQTQKNYANRILFCKCSPDAHPTFMKSSWDVTFVKPFSAIRNAISKAWVGSHQLLFVRWSKRTTICALEANIK